MFGERSLLTWHGLGIKIIDVSIGDGEDGLRDDVLGTEKTELQCSDAFWWLIEDLFFRCIVVRAVHLDDGGWVLSKVAHWCFAAAPTVANIQFVVTPSDFIESPPQLVNFDGAKWGKHARAVASA